MARVELRLSDKEKEELVAKAKASSISVSELIRQSVLRVKTWTIEDREIKQAKIREINRIGVNLNQIARYCNQHKSDVDTAEIVSLLVAIDQELMKL